MESRGFRGAIAMLGQKEVYHIFMPLFPNTSTRMILKKSELDTAIRKGRVSKTLARMSREWKNARNELRGFPGDGYKDYVPARAASSGRSLRSSEEERATWAVAQYDYQRVCPHSGRGAQDHCPEV